MDDTSYILGIYQLSLIHVSINGIWVIRSKKEVARNSFHDSYNLRVSCDGVSTHTAMIDVILPPKATIL